MADIWFISDTHFFHENILHFKIEGGLRMREEFTSWQEMNEAMIERWNARVKPGDKVWHLGDVALGLDKIFPDHHMGKLALHKLLNSLNGHKRLVLGNHDNAKSKVLQDHFHKIQLWKSFDEHGFKCTHVPHMMDQLRGCVANVHGHIHTNVIDDPRYINICVEKIGYAPIHLDEIKAIITKRGLI
jgi:calcineurin-like phosphoesterase family protein